MQGLGVLVWGLGALCAGCAAPSKGDEAARAAHAAWEAERARDRALDAAREAEGAREGAREADHAAWGGAVDAALAARGADGRAGAARGAPRAAAADFSAWPRPREPLAARPAAARRPLAPALPAPPAARPYRAGPRSLLHVDERRAGMDQDGSRAHPFATIGAALRVAGPGSTIEVAPAVYEEEVRLVPRVVLRGRAGTRVAGRLVLASGCLVEDLAVTCRAEEARAVVGAGLEDVTLRRVRVSAFEVGERGHAVGIDLARCRRARIEGCVVEDVEERAWGSACGIRLIACQVKLVGNRVERVHEADWGFARGIALAGCEGEVVGNVVLDVRETLWSDAVGIHLQRTRALVLHNTVLGVGGTAWESAAGIRLEADCRAEVRANLVADVCADDGAQGIDNRSASAIVAHNAVGGVVARRPYRGRAEAFSGPRDDENLEQDLGLDARGALPAGSALRRAFAAGCEGEGEHLGAAGAPEVRRSWAPESAFFREASRHHDVLTAFSLR